jgi:hypothetical protein
VRGASTELVHFQSEVEVEPKVALTTNHDRVARQPAII